MGAVELKSNIHRIVDKTQDESLLQIIYDFLTVKNKNKDGKLWASLTQTEREELLSAYQESDDEKNLLDRNILFKRKG